MNACPNLRAVSVTGVSAGANVKNVIAVSNDGDRVYFTATGALRTAPSSQGLLPEAGQNNLYLWEAPSGEMAFLAALPQATLHGAQATPDGQYLAFTTTADLTTDDTSTAAQAFRYDALSHELV